MFMIESDILFLLVKVGAATLFTCEGLFICDEVSWF